MTRLSAAPSAEEIYQYRGDLYRYARLQLRNDTLAEDVTSQTLLAALEQADRFLGQSSLKTWLIGILKYKVLDAFRLQQREIVTDPQSQSEEEAANALNLENAMFDASGHFADPPSDWGDPEASLSQIEFFQILEVCLEQLPTEQGRAFMMHEWLEMESEAICKELKISSTNYYVLQHRAKLRLRECLSQRWFATKKIAPL